MTIVLSRFKQDCYRGHWIWLASQMNPDHKKRSQVSRVDLVGQLRSKLAIWFLTGHGPFRTSRGDDKSCRFCSKSLELPEHLLFECEKLAEFRLSRESIKIENFESSVWTIVSRMFRQGWDLVFKLVGILLWDSRSYGPSPVTRTHPIKGIHSSV